MQDVKVIYHPSPLTYLLAIGEMGGVAVQMWGYASLCGNRDKLGHAFDLLRLTFELGLNAG